MTGRINMVKDIRRRSKLLLAIKSAIQEGIDSGIATDFDPEKYLENLKGKKRSNG